LTAQIRSNLFIVGAQRYHLLAGRDGQPLHTALMEWTPSFKTASECQIRSGFTP
jgi:hypothetical protein